MAFNNENAYFYERIEVTAGQVKQCPILASGRTPSRCFLTVEQSNIRYMYHGGTPTISAGHLAQAGSGFSLDGIDNVRNLRFTATSGTAFVELTLESS